MFETCLSSTDELIEKGNRIPLELLALYEILGSIDSGGLPIQTYYKRYNT